MSLISCPLFTLQLKIYWSKMFGALAAAWLIPRLTLTELLPCAAHGTSQTTAIPALGLSCCWAARQEASWVIVMHLSALQKPETLQAESQPSPSLFQTCQPRLAPGADSWALGYPPQLGAAHRGCRRDLPKVALVHWHLHQGEPWGTVHQPW